MAPKFKEFKLAYEVTKPGHGLLNDSPLREFMAMSLA